MRQPSVSVGAARYHDDSMVRRAQQAVRCGGRSLRQTGRAWAHSLFVKALLSWLICSGSYGFAPLLQSRIIVMDLLTAFGLFAVTATLVCYAYEHSSPVFILGFAVACGLGSTYGFLQGAWPFGVVEAVWSLVALRRWWLADR